MTDPKEFCAFILAAGEGRRLRPHTDHMPKPMVPVAGSPILAHTLDHLERAGVSEVTINTFYKADVIEEFLRSHGRALNITLSKETELLNTGLGMKQALSNMKGKPFFAINGDAFWQDTNVDCGVFKCLANAWQPEKMDVLLLLQPVSEMILTKGIGDYDLDSDGHVQRSLNQSGAYMFAGVRICTPEVFDNTPDTPFSFLEIMDRAEKAGRLYGLIHDGAWHHISTPEDLARVNESLEDDNTAEACA